MNEPVEDLSKEEQARLAALGADVEPPAHLEQRILGDLRASGAFAPGLAAKRGRRGMQLVAALLLGVVLGVAGRGTWSATPEGRRFLLLVHSTPEQVAALTPTELSQRVAEYGAWARDLGDTLLDAGKLAAEREAVPPLAEASQLTGRTEPAGTVQGYFLVRSESRDRARAIAMTCPHLSYGGWLELREVER